MLLRNEGIYNYPSLYNYGHSLLIAMTSYLPFVLLIAIILLLAVMEKIFRHNKSNQFAKYAFAINNFTYVILIGLFVYWILFDVFT